jgi:hypothetical protein
MRVMMTVDAGMCTTKLMHYAVLHDVGEMAGDIPWPKSEDQKRSQDAAEARVRAKMGHQWGLPGLPVLSATERAFFKCCECIEMWEFGMQERNMGNRYASVVEARMLAQVTRYLDALPTDTVERVRRYVELRTAQESEVELVTVRDPRHPLHHRAEAAPAAAQEFVERMENQS